MYQFEVNLKVPQLLIVTAFTCSAVLLAALMMKQVKFESFKTDQIELTQAMAVDLELTAALNQAQTQVLLAAHDTVFNEPEPDLVIMKLKKAAETSQSALQSFLSGLGSSTFSAVSASDIKSAGPAASYVSGKGITSSINYAAMVPQKTAAPAEVVNHAELKNLIASHQKSFQVCYEKSLLKDEFLSGNATVLLKIGAKADVAFKGIGKENSKTELRNCLSQRALAMSFSNQYRGKSVRFSLYFNN